MNTPDKPFKKSFLSIQPTWEGTSKLLLLLLEDGSDEGKDFARGEIVRMGVIIDGLKASQPEPHHGPTGKPLPNVKL
jgi:hypothetical protein